jgi:hypothetical protein
MSWRAGQDEVWFGNGRRAHVAAVEEYLNRRQRAGTLTLPGPAPLVARTIVELCALWAGALPFEPAPHPPGTGRAEPIDDTVVAAMLAQLLVKATTSPR